MRKDSTYPPSGVVPYDSGWPDKYREMSTGLSAALGGWVTEHIGSTSVPGLAAKPVIDIAARVPAGSHAVDRKRSLSASGWTVPESIGSHNCSFWLEGNMRTAIVHFFPEATWPTAHQRLFAAWLRAHPEDREAYGALKQQLYDGGVWGRAYTLAKTGFVQCVVDQARAAMGLQTGSVSVSVSVWDKD